MKSKHWLLKRVSAAVLTAAMALQPVCAAPVWAAGGDSTSGKNKLEVDVRLDLPTPNVPFTFKLSKGGASVWTEQENSGAAGNIVEAEFAGLAPATDYVLEVSAPGYAAYRQTVSITGGFTSQIYLHNNTTMNSMFQSGDTKYGIMAVGDMDGNGVIDDADTDAMMNAIIQADKSGTVNNAYDLNGDQRVDAADLTYITMNREHTGKETATVKKLISADSFKTPEPENGTTVKQGNIGNLLSEKINETTGKEEIVTLQPKDPEKPISKDNPVEISLDVKSSSEEISEAPSIQGIVIKPPLDTANKITSGVVTVTGTPVDASGNAIGDGKDEVYEIPIGSGAGGSPGTEMRSYAGDTTLPAAIFLNAPAMPSGTVKMMSEGTAASAGTSNTESDGRIVINLGAQIAIKKVSIRVTGASTSLVDIAKVEFLNDMAQYVGEPELNIPTGITVGGETEGLYPSFTVS